ncbi:MAG: phosphatase PAP2 family protein [Cyclobacteriaceae bacterium]
MKKSKSCLVFTFGLYFSSAILLVLLAIFISKGEEVLWINGHHSTFLDSFFVVITDLGAGLLFIPLLIILLFVRFKYAVLTVSVWITHGIICSVLKRGIFGYLKRPKEIIDNDLLHFVPDVNVHSHFSFPSGHTATIFCLAFLLSLLIKRKWASMVFILIALVVAYSRVYLLQHFLMDVAAGSVIGIVATYFLWHYFETAKLPEWMNNYLKINLTLKLAE